MKKKVLYVITKSNWGGAQRYVFDLATNLPKEEFEVAVTLGGTGQADALQGTLDSKLRAAGVRTLFVPSFMRDISLRREWSAFRELKEIIATERPDVVHLNSSKAGGLGAWAAHRARWLVADGMRRAEIVFTSHGLPWDEDRNIFSRAAIWLATWITFLLCDTVIVISQDAYARAKRLPFCSKKLRLVHNGLATLPLLNRDQARLALNIEVPVPVVGAIANLEWNKGLHYLVRAAGVLKRQGKSCLMYIIGEGEERKFLETLIEEEGVQEEVHLAGFKEEAWRYLPAFEIFALPSVKEGLPYVLLEAGQAARAVVGSNIPGIAEVVGDGVSGFLFKTKNHHDLASKIAKLLDEPNLREEFGANLAKRVQNEFSLEHMVEQTAALY
jgi:glycosyltransferase involved in cell wall biosynthesis